MTNFLIVLGVILAIVIFAEILFGRRKKWGYKYYKKKFLMTRSEHEFFDLLISTIGEKYHIFAQVHLTTLLDHKIRGQSWLGAFSHINQKSVDFVLCDKAYISPKLVIELDDKSHEDESRVIRDGEVERILKEADLPLLRIKNSGNFNPEEITQKITNLILE